MVAQQQKPALSLSSFFFRFVFPPNMYENWSNDMQHRICMLKWYKLKDVLVYIHTIQHRLVDGKTWCAIPKLQDYPCPANESLRFPEKEAYICEAVGDWSSIFCKLQLLLGILKDHSKLYEYYPGVHSVGEVETTIVDLTHDILQNIEIFKDIFTRNSFEARYSLAWKDLR